nr:MAG TPA: hypothetical protein [Bacteriophage sp.]
MQITVMLIQSLGRVLLLHTERIFLLLILSRLSPMERR